MAKGRLVHQGGAFLALTASLVVTMLFVVPPAHAVTARPFSPFGVTSHLIGNYPQSRIDRELDLVHAAGAQWVRVDVPWRFVEPQRDRFDPYPLSQLDNVVACASKRGLRVQAVVIEFPDWSNGGRGPWAPPADDRQFEEFMRFMAARYKGRITYWELGNEVNQSEFWEVPRASSPARYARFLQHGYRGAKAGNPDAQIISAGLAGSDYNYLQELYNAGAKGYFDILGVHAYTQGKSPFAVDALTPSRTFGGLAVMKSTMERNGEPAKRIWVTEVGWQTSSATDHVSPERQAQYTYDAYKRLFRDFPYVDALFIYTIRDTGASASIPRDNYGLLEHDYRSKPAYAAFRRASDVFVRTPTSVSLSLSRSVVARGGRVRVFGKLLGAPGGRVKIQRASGGSWSTLRTVPIDASGAYSTLIGFDSAGTRRLRAVYAGGPARRPSHSGTRALTVR